MKTLIINGSPKKKGDTVSLIDELVKNLNGEVKILSCFSNISPCNDCRHCWSNSGCSINDEMQGLYPYIQECDNVVLASPIWFSCLSGPTLNIGSRIQTLYAAKHFREEQVSSKEKNGVIILVGSEKGTEVIPTKIASTILKLMNVRRRSIETIYSLDTNKIPAAEDIKAIDEVHRVAKFLNDLYKSK